MDVAAVDLFCGVGGLTYGLREEKLPVVAGIDVNTDCKFPYETNNKNTEGLDRDAEFVEMDLSDLEEPTSDGRDKVEVVESLFGDAEIRVLVGCAPCQPFSPYNHGKQITGHEKWSMLDQFSRIVEEMEIPPDVVSMENVYEVRNHDVYDRFLDTLARLGYHFPREEEEQKDAFRVYCPEYGIPQTRKRWVFLASRHGEIDLEEPINTDESEYPTVRDAIGHLTDPEQPLGPGEVDDVDPLHRARNLAEINRERIQISEPGKTWKEWVEKDREDLLLECHKKENGRSYTDQYGRMEWEKPSPTITTQFFKYGTGRFGHPGYEEGVNRALSVREGALLQTFPEDYEFAEDHRELPVNKAGDFIGNAVPPKLGEVIGKSIRRHLAATTFQRRISSANEMQV